MNPQSLQHVSKGSSVASVTSVCDFIQQNKNLPQQFNLPQTMYMSPSYQYRAYDLLVYHFRDDIENPQKGKLIW